MNADPEKLLNDPQYLKEFTASTSKFIADLRAEAKKTGDNCLYCLVGDVKLKKCSACNKAKYCSLDCQKNDRERHKSECVLPKCLNCKATGVKLQKCAACKKARYCSPECQSADWKIHKPYCLVLRPKDAKQN